MKHRGIVLPLLIIISGSMLTFTFNIQPIEADAPAGEPQLIAASTMPELESFFRYQEPWLGSDAAYSLNISEFHPNTILWTFGDTLWGRIEDGTKVWTNMTNNSVALYNLKNGTIEFYHGQGNIFEMAEWVEADQPFGPWAFAPFIQNGKIYWFLLAIDLAGWKDPPGDWLADIYLAEVDNPEATPEDWNVNYYPIDFLPVKYDPHSFLWLATNVYVENDTYYLYGILDVRDTLLDTKGHFVVARTQENITNFDSWEFYDGENWSSAPQTVQNGPSDLSTEYSVHYLPSFDKYLLIYQKGGIEDRFLKYSIWGRWADTPIGPWGEPQLLYTPPGLYLNESYWAYAVKGHYPYLSETDTEVVVSYVLSSFNEEALSNPLLYCPYFVKLTFQKVSTEMFMDHNLTYDGENYNVTTISNSTITNFQFDQSEKVINFNVSGPDYTAGFCRIAIPNILIQEIWKGNYAVLVDGKEPITLKNWTAGTNTYLYFTYLHSTHEVTIVPEFPSAIFNYLYLILPLVMIVILVLVVLRKKFYYAHGQKHAH